MACGACQVQRDQAKYTTETILLLLPPPVGARRIFVTDYNWIRNAGDTKAPSGHFLMSERIEQACAADWSGSACIAARALWRQEWPTGECLGPDGKVYCAGVVPSRTRSGYGQLGEPKLERFR